MRSLPFPDYLRNYSRILGEGAVIERLRRDPAGALDPHVVNSAFVYNPAKRRLLENIYRQYLQIGFDHDLPLVMSAPTWRATEGNIAASGHDGLDVNGDNVRLLQGLRDEFGSYAAKVVIGGLIGCRGDAYQPGVAMGAKEAGNFHRWQAERLAAAGVDFLFGITLPALSEALGLAAAMATTGRPFVVSFVVRPSGTLLDGTSLNAAVAAIDGQVSPQPTAFLINCTHPDFARAALFHPANSSPLVRQRIAGLLGNTAAMSPEALDGREKLVEAEPEQFASAMSDLGCDAGLKILGGCCGTDDRHIRCLAARLAARS
jgi:homocysteine S-methyltransferase